MTSKNHKTYRLYSERNIFIYNLATVYEISSLKNGIFTKII